MKRLPKIFAILTIGLMLSSVSYAGSDASPGKATKIESMALPSYSYEAINLAPVMVVSFANVQAQPTENVMIVKRCEALPVTVIEPTAVKRRWRSDTNYFTSNDDRTRPGYNSTKFSDRHRRLCNVG